MDKTLIKGVNLLQLMVESARPWTVSALSKALGLQASNVHRTLQTWCALGFVAQAEKTGEYHCTLKLFEWGCKVEGCFDVRPVAREHLLLLAEASQETIHLSVPDPLPCPTSKSIGSLKNLKLELAQIRSCGYATNLEEWHEGVHGLGAAIFDRSGAAVAAVGLTGPASRMGEERTRELGQLVLATAEKITRALGGRLRQRL